MSAGMRKLQADREAVMRALPGRISELATRTRIGTYRVGSALIGLKNAGLVERGFGRIWRAREEAPE